MACTCKNLGIACVKFTGKIARKLVADLALLSYITWNQFVESCLNCSKYSSSHPRFSIKEVFLKILQYSQENTWVSLLIKLQSSGNFMALGQQPY